MKVWTRNNATLVVLLSVSMCVHVFIVHVLSGVHAYREDVNRYVLVRYAFEGQSYSHPEA